MASPVVGILATICTVLMVIGIFTPGWLLLNDNIFSFQWGIWVLRYCSSGVCTTLSSAVVNSKTSDTNISVIEFQVESLLALLCGIVGSVLGFVYWRKSLADQNEPVNGFGIVGVFALASAGVFIWIPTGKTISMNITLSSIGASIGVPYSVITCALTGVGYWIVAIVFLVTVCDGRRQVPQQGFIQQANPMVVVQQSGMQYQPSGVPYTGQYNQQGVVNAGYPGHPAPNYPRKM